MELNDRVRCVDNAVHLWAFIGVEGVVVGFDYDDWVYVRFNNCDVPERWRSRLGAQHIITTISRGNLKVVEKQNR